MPTTYAHWRFGDRVKRTLSADTEAIIDKYRELYDIGVHGPDLFFYYDCLKKENLFSFGSKLHKRSMKSLLEQFRGPYLKSDNRQASLAYILGFVSHFTLDSYCHSYIEMKKEKEGPSHNKIESQYDRHLLLIDGKDPNRTRVADTIKASEFNARIIRQFFSQFDQKTVYKIIHDQHFYLTLLKDTSDAKRFVLTTAMTTFKLNDFLDLLTTKIDEPSCENSNMRLDKLFEKAALHFRILAENAIDYLENGAELDPYFENDFAEKDDYMSIPLYDASQEKDYRV